VTSAFGLAPPMPFRMLLDEAMKRTRLHFRQLFFPVAIPLGLAAAAVPIAQWALFSTLPSLTLRSGRDLIQILPGFVGVGLAIVFFLGAYALGYTALFVACVDAVAGRGVEMGRAWLFPLRLRVLGTLLLTFLTLGLGFIFCLLPGIYLSLLLSFTLPVMVDEDQFGTSAMSRSATLARHNPQRAFEADPRLKIFILGFVGILLSYVTNIVVQLPFIVVQQVMMFRDIAGGKAPDPVAIMGRTTLLQVPSQFLGTLVNIAVRIYVCFGIALLFFDVKRRREGRDLERAIDHLVASRRGRTLPAPPEAPPQT